MNKDKLIQTAEESNILDPGLITEFFEKKYDGHRRLDLAMLESGLFTEEQILQLFGKLLDLPYIENIDVSKVPDEFVAKVSATYAQKHGLIAIEKRDSQMTVATSQPLSLFSIDNVGKRVRMSIKPVLALRASITTAINTAYEQRVTVLEDVADEVSEQSIEELVGEITASEDLLDVVNRPPVIRLVNDILFRALQLRASDVHVHPLEQKINIRYRIDGILYDMLTLDAHILPVIVSRIKVMAGMDIAEKRLPQDGRCSVNIGPREIDLRVSTVPTAYGERTVLRLLDKSTGIYTFNKLGMSADDLKRVDTLLDRTHGVFFVTGPTGSGKTTSLYSFLQRLDATKSNIITVEDPIEYQLDGISQIQVASKKGMTFITALRHVLRQDPDVIMVGEVRDQETARMVIQSSLTGHLVFSTLHTNDAPGAITRMLDLGVEPYLVASSVIAVLAQRLVRRLCPKCKELVKLDNSKTKEISLELGAFKKIYHGKGCQDCFNTGYRGRTGIYELMVIDDHIRQCIYKHETAGAIKKVALNANMTTLRMDGLKNVERGITTLDEILRVVQSDDVA
ncbi:MAG: Flp pilus assembly complex ATPase component TadA [Planctomycetes bacterium]|nr:Flp pilus assembly complex ATPase component TadA [Planctomycetota bacterium]